MKKASFNPSLVLSTCKIHVKCVESTFTLDINIYQLCGAEKGVKTQTAKERVKNKLPHNYMFILRFNLLMIKTGSYLFRMVWLVHQTTLVHSVNDTLLASTV